jgi:predicted DNA-binding transcriptional regulator AlpA
MGHISKSERSQMTASKIEPSAVPANTDEILTIGQAAKIVNKSVSTMYSLRSTGQGPRSGKLGRRVVYKRSDLLAWIESAFEGGAA